MNFTRHFKDIVRKFLGYHDLYMVSLTASDMRPYLWEYRKIAQRKKTTPRLMPDVWCGYLLALLECDEKEEFDAAFKRFVSLGGGGTQLKDYLWLSKVATEKGLFDDELIKSANVYDKLMSYHSRHALEEFVSGKTVAIVGNGPSELGKGLGDEIDSHDVVIRINNHTVKGFERDYGTRTDMWAKHTTDYLKHERTEPGIKFILYAANWMRDRLVYGYREAIENDLTDCIVDYCDAKDRQPLTEGLGIHPTTGALLIEMLRKTEMKSLDVYGFSFLESKPADTYTHYMNDMSLEKLKKEVAAHKMDVEMAYLKTLFRNGRRYNP